MGDTEPMVVLKQGDVVLWQSDGTSGVGTVSLTDGKVCWIKGVPSPIKQHDIHFVAVKNCTKITPAIAKLYLNSNG
jgi:hypothetical protein